MQLKELKKLSGLLTDFSNDYPHKVEKVRDMIDEEIVNKEMEEGNDPFEDMNEDYLDEIDDIDI